MLYHFTVCTLFTLCSQARQSCNTYISNQKYRVVHQRLSYGRVKAYATMPKAVIGSVFISESVNYLRLTLFQQEGRREHGICHMFMVSPSSSELLLIFISHNIFWPFSVCFNLHFRIVTFLKPAVSAFSRLYVTGIDQHPIEGVIELLTVRMVSGKFDLVCFICTEDVHS